MSEIKFIRGDATKPIGKDNKILVHICNDIGGWGKGFVTAISGKWNSPEKEYRNWFRSGEGFKLGKVQFVKVEETLWVANMICQHKIKNNANGVPPIRYESVKEALKTVATKCDFLKASIHMPRVGCGLAGGNWNEIEAIIKDELIMKSLDVTVYDYV